jgi:hypothetical protein
VWLTISQSLSTELHKPADDRACVIVLGESWLFVTVDVAKPTRAAETFQTNNAVIARPS